MMINHHDNENLLDLRLTPQLQKEREGKEKEER